jgi:hypothetical protein
MSLLNPQTISQPDNDGPNSPDAQYGKLVRDVYALLQRDPRYNIPPYDVWEPLVIGGLSGVYQLMCPFDTNAEYRVLYLASTDVTTAYIGQLPNQPAPTNTTNISGDPTISTPTPDSGLRGVVLASAANTTSPGPDEWLPFSPSDSLTIRLSVATSHAAWVGILFRRRRQPSGVWTEGA